MSSRRKRLGKLLALARGKASPEAVSPATMPYGFATGVAARWASGKRNGGMMNSWLRACWWGVGGATAICIATAVYQSTLPQTDGLDLLVDAMIIEGEPF